MKKFFKVLFLLFFSTQVFSSMLINSANYYDSDFEKIVESISQKTFNGSPSKISYIANLFLNKPYIFNPLGEGSLGEFDRFPLYRSDFFDCETYVDTVIALTLAKDLTNFKDLITKIRYKNGHISFIDRNHFTCLDWNVNNQTQKFVQDITINIKDSNGHYIAKLASALIDKPNWYRNLPISRIRLPEISDVEKSNKLKDLHAKGDLFKKTLSSVPYIPLDKIFVKDNDVDMKILEQIPSGAIIEIVRPNWDLKKIIGTNMNISHLGFVIWEDNVPYFIHASSDKMLVVKTKLIDYLKNSKQSPTIKGINVQIILIS